MAALTHCASAPPARVSIQSAPPIALENMLHTFKRDGVSDRVYVLELSFSRLFSGSVEQIDATCRAQDVVLRARQLEASPGDEQYQAYLYTDHTSAARLRPGHQRIQCTITLDGAQHELEHEVYLVGAPLGTPFELLKPTLTAIDCNTGASPRQGQPLCVHINARNDNLTRANPQGSVSARCQAAGQAATTTTTLNQLPQLQVRFDRAPTAGAHTLSCTIVGHDQLATTTIEVSSVAPRFALELVKISAPRRHAKRGHDSPMGMERVSAQVQARALGDSPLWHVVVHCTAPATNLVLSAVQDARHGSVAPLAVGAITTMSAWSYVDEAIVTPKALRCVAQATTRAGDRVLAQSDALTSPSAE